MNRLGRILLLAMALLIVVGAAAAGAVWLGGKVTPGLAAEGDLAVAITSPGPGTQVQLGVPVIVRAMASAGLELASLELWVGGEIVDASWPAGPDSGWQPIGVFSWTPTKPGPTLLIARARQPGGQTHNSSPLSLNVVQGQVALIQPDAPSSAPNQALTTSGSGQPPAGGFSSPAQPFPEDDEPPSPPANPQPAREWSPGLNNLLTRASSLLAPSGDAPHLAASLNGCQVELLLQHDDAGGFGIALERISTSGSFDVEPLATVEIPPGETWATYLDADPPPGPNQYQAVLMTPDGKYGSNLVAVEVPDEDCPEAWMGSQLTFLKLLHPQTGPAADRAYCYLGRGAAGYTRWPAVGFLEPVGTGYGTAGQLAQLAFSPQDLAEGDVHVECWGWSGDDLHLLGEFHGAGDTLGDGTGSFGPWDGASLQIDTDLFDAGDLKHVDESAWFAARLPYIYAELTFDPNVCGNHLPADAQNVLGKVLFCTPYPIYDVGEQPYLVWTVIDGSCPLGSDCLTSSELQAIADNNNAKVGFGIYSSSNGMVPFEKRPLDFSTYVVWPPDPEFYCGIQRSYSVRMYYEGQPYGEGQPWQTVHGPTSNIVHIPFTCPPPEGVLVEVDFNSIQFGNIDDNDNGPEVLEVYGAVYATGGSILDVNNYLLISEWGAPYGDCSGDYDNWSSTHEALCPQVIGANYNSTLNYNFPWPMCRSSSLVCPGFNWYDGHRSLEVYVEDGDAINVGIMLYDYDALSANDKVCVVSVWTPKLSAAEWAAHQGAQWWMYQGDNGNASCEVYWTTTAKEVYY